MRMNGGVKKRNEYEKKRKWESGQNQRGAKEEGLAQMQKAWKERVEKQLSITGLSWSNMSMAMESLTPIHSIYLLPILSFIDH
jgi:hypothetical protein